MKLLTTKQYKLDKGHSAGVLTAGITLSPAGEASEILGRTLPSTCAMAGTCAEGCLKFAGRNQLPTHALARARRTASWYDDKPAFLAQAVSEFKQVAQRAKRQNMLPAGRPNLLSDLPVMARAIARRVPNMQFYDYTKIRRPWERTLANYHLTYSVSERSTVQDIKGAFDHKINCAVVVDIAKGDPIPATHTEHGITRPTIDGDVTDLRFTDPVGVYVILRWKGSRARLETATAGHFARATS
jgi:hypothetical protein